MHYATRLLTASILSLTQTVFAESGDSVRVIIKYKQPPAAIASLQAQLTKTTALPIQSMQAMAGGAYTMTVNSARLRTAVTKEIDATTLVLSRLRKLPNVVYAVKDRVGQFKPLPQPEVTLKKPRLSHEAQWDEFSRPGGVMLESAPYLRDGAWAHTTGMATKPVVIAVLDTGIAPHDSLINNLLKDNDGNLWGWNFSANNNNLQDETKSYHGTHVAGTIAGYGDVMTGMGEHLKILPVKIPGESGMFYESALINAIYWSVGSKVPGAPTNPYPANVLNMSFGVDERPGKEIDHCDEPLQEAIWFARKQGAVIVTAAGNDNRWEHYNAPAVCNGTIKVAATGPEGLRAYYSNYGPAVTFAAPGGDLKYGTEGGILSTVNPGSGYNQSGFDFYQGTSMAAPHVAGVAGLVVAANQRPISAENIEKILYVTTHNFGQSDNPNDACIDKKPCGHGILDAENAVKAAIARFDVIFSAPTTQAPIKNSKAKQEVNSSSTYALENHWIPVKSRQPKASYVVPYVQQGKDGNIYAYSGTHRYRLDAATYQHCQIIGFDGVGCYR